MSPSATLDTIASCSTVKHIYPLCTISRVRQQYRPAGDEGILLVAGFGDILEMKMKFFVTGIRGDEHEHRAAFI